MIESTEATSAGLAVGVAGPATGAGVVLGVAAAAHGSRPGDPQHLATQAKRQLRRGGGAQAGAGDLSVGSQQARTPHEPPKRVGGDVC